MENIQGIQDRVIRAGFNGSDSNDFYKAAAREMKTLSDQSIIDEIVHELGWSVQAGRSLQNRIIRSARSLEAGRDEKVNAVWMAELAEVQIRISL